MGNLDPEEARRPSLTHPNLNDVVFAGLAEIVEGQRFIVSGDWNAARLFDSTWGGTAGVEFFARPKDRGWYDCVWETRGEEVQTFFREGNAPYQLDHAFCDQNTTRESSLPARVLTEAVTELGLSDQAPVVLDLEM